MIGTSYQQHLTLFCTHCKLYHTVPVGVPYNCGNCGQCLCYGFVPSPAAPMACATDTDVEKIASTVEWRVAGIISNHSLTDTEVERIATAINDKLRVSLMLQMGVINEAIRSDRRDSGSAGEGAGADRGGAEGERKPVLQEPVRGPEERLGSLPDPPF